MNRSRDIHNDRILSDLEFLDLNVITEIQKDIDPADMISLMFLLYEDAPVALNNLLLYERLVTIGVSRPSLLHEWAAQARTRCTWKLELLEALVTCQLYSVIRRLGFYKQSVVELFQKQNETANFIKPLKKIFYRVCENMDAKSYTCFKQIISSSYVNIPNYETCELLFLELMCQNAFTTVTPIGENVKKILHILLKIPSYDIQSLNYYTKSYIHENDTTEILTQPSYLETPTTSKVLEDNQKKTYVKDLKEEFKSLNELSFENVNWENLKTDDESLNNNHGLCYIINQEEFPKSDSADIILTNRPESAVDRMNIEKTMKNHHIEVISRTNLSRMEMLHSIKNITTNAVKHYHKVFFLFILSHGCRDHVYSVNSERVSIFEIEELLGSDNVNHIRKIPRVFVLQACQADEIILKADSSKSHIKRSNMITFCSTIPGYKAYRERGKGSLFIRSLCRNIQEHSNKEHLTDLFTKVTRDVEQESSARNKEQLPIILRNTLLSKIYLKNALNF